MASNLLDNVTIIGEVKTKSPFGYESEKSFEEQFEFCNEHADWISIHTDPRWDGSFEKLRWAKKHTDKPVLAKGIHKLDCRLKEALSIADYALVVDRIPTGIGNHDGEILYEMDYYKALLGPDKKVVWNQRDLETGEFRGGILDARRATTGWLCQASGIKTVDDVCEGVDAVLVGTHFEKFIRSCKDVV